MPIDKRLDVGTSAELRESRASFRREETDIIKQDHVAGNRRPPKVVLVSAGSTKVGTRAPHALRPSKAKLAPADLGLQLIL